jgi:hypothetical protein
MVYLAADKLNCHPDTIYKRARKEKPIADAIEHARGKMLDVAESALKCATLNGEAWAVCFTLKTIGKHRGYVERIEHEHRSIDAKIRRELDRLGISREEAAAGATPTDPDAGYVN